VVSLIIIGDKALLRSVVLLDCRTELERREEQFDIIIGDLADPVDGGPCFKLYTQSFYERVLKPRLALGGIVVTQVGLFNKLQVAAGAFVCVFIAVGRQVFL
jgi:thermospermine synthase